MIRREIVWPRHGDLDGEELLRFRSLKWVLSPADPRAVKAPRNHAGTTSFALVSVVLAAITALMVFGPLSDRTWEQPGLLFGAVVVAAVIGIAATTITIALADRRELAEFGLLGAGLMAAAIMPMVRGLVTPGVLYDDNAAFHTAAFLALPTAALVVAPLLRPDSRFGQWAARNWRDWTLLALLGMFVLGALVVFFPDAVTIPGPTSPITVAVSVAMVVVIGLLARRQLHFYGLGRRTPNLVAALSLAALACSALLPIVETPYSSGFWWLHTVGLLGVLGGSAGLAVSKGLTTSTQEILAPVLTRDPLVAFELGLSPVVHQFVADLERKDKRTRDHTIRTGEMALRVGERMRMNPNDLRELGLAAMLHDVGKLRISTDIFNKPGSLTDAEYEEIKLHTVYGEEMLAGEPALAGAAAIVRSHHERVDGAGYPDGRSGTEIPLASRIIAVCDAFDAMTHDRPHRAAMPIGMANAVLREHAGSQWDANVIEHAIAVLPTMLAHSPLDGVGRTVLPSDEVVDLDDGEIAEILHAVDVEI